jgi:hypothetical protein
MLFFDGALGLVLLAVWLFCIIDVITTPDAQIRNLPKLAWLLIVIALVDLGSIAWLVAGRNWSGNNSLVHKGNRSSCFPEYDRPGRFVPTNPDDDEAFLRQLRERAEQQRQDYQTRREQELRAERDQLLGNREDDRPDPDSPNG